MFQEMVIARADNDFVNDSDATLTVGRDGAVYIGSIKNPAPSVYVGKVLRCDVDGLQLSTITIPWIVVGNVTAGPGVPFGPIAAAHQHMQAQVVLYDNVGRHLAGSATFNHGDSTDYLAPKQVEAGSSAFYALDRHYRPPVGRIVRIEGDGVLSGAWTDPNSAGALASDFRVVEPSGPGLGGRFIIRQGSQLRTATFTSPGEPLPEGQGLRDTFAPVSVAGLVGFDVHYTGTTIAVGRAIPTTVGAYEVTLIDRSGSVSPTQLIIPDASGPQKQPPITGVRLSNDWLVIKRADPAELFLRFKVEPSFSFVYDKTVYLDHETIRIEVDDDPWLSSGTVPLTIVHSVFGLVNMPALDWKVWACTAGCSDWSELAYRSSVESPTPRVRRRSGQLSLSTHLLGLVHLRISPELEPLHGDKPCEYAVDVWIEIRERGTSGTVTVRTSHSRATYRQAEEIPVLLTRRPLTPQPQAVTISLVDADDPAFVLGSASIVLSAADNKGLYATNRGARPLIRAVG